MKFPRKQKPLLVCGIFLIMLATYTFSCHPAQNDSYLNFPDKLTHETPFDVDTALEHKLLSEKKFAEAQRIFEVLSWQMFISLNWPVNEKGEAKDEITDQGDRIWEHWKESYEIFKEDGSKPLTWGSKTELPAELAALKPNNNEELLFRTSKFSSFAKERWKRNGKGRTPFVQPDEVDQAFTSPIWDQNGNVVRYEIRLNKSTVDTIVDNGLYNLDGQIAFSKAHKKVDFAKSTMSLPGSIELKFAWKIMVPGKDHNERYFTKKVYVLDSMQKVREVTVGLVAMHIGTKTASSPQWIWATFEHVDNLETNSLEQVGGHYLKPSFNDPDCATCPINLFPTKNPKKNQIQRIFPIPVATQELNKQVQSLLRKKQSFWQYYQLIGTQWPTDPSAAPYPLNSTVYKLPDAVVNKSGGNPTPVFLTNMIMETYFQGATNIDSTSHYNMTLANEPAYFQIEGQPRNDPSNTNQIIFGTEGCVNCHSSASIAVRDTFENGIRKPIFGQARTSDFEWLMQRKAHFLASKKITKPSTSKK